MLSIVQQGSMKDQWILDSGASFHMTSHGDWFHTYQSYNGTVYMDVNSSCTIVGVGEVRIKIFVALFI